MFLTLKIDTRPSKSKDLVPDLGFAFLSVYGGRSWNFEPWPLGFVLISVSTSFLVSILHVFKTSLFVFCCDFEVTEEKNIIPLCDSLLVISAAVLGYWAPS